MATAFSAEQEARAFAIVFPTPAVKAAIEKADDGTLTWEAVRDLFTRVLVDAMDRVAL